MQRLLFFIISVIHYFVFTSVYCQAQTYKSTAYAYASIQDGKYTWGDWKKSNLTITLDLDRNKIIINSLKVQTYTIYKIFNNGEVYTDNSGGKNTKYGVIDQDGDKGEIRLRLEKNGNNQIYVDFNDFARVYNIKRYDENLQSAQNNRSTTLTKQSPIGTIGILNGREAIVVDLGGEIGKVAIATKNIGATSVYVDIDSKKDMEFDKILEACWGDHMTYDEAVNASKKGTWGKGWYLPSKVELEALGNNLEWNEEQNGAEWNVTPNASLFLPAAGDADYIHDLVFDRLPWKGYYWSRTLYGSEEPWSLEIDNDFIWVVAGEEGGYRDDDCVYTVRPFCALP